MDVKTKLEEEIERTFESLKEMYVGSDEYKLATENLTKLIDKYNDIVKVESENKKIGQELYFDEKKCKIEQKKNRREFIFNIIAKALEIGCSVGVTIWGTNKMLKFEETGSVSTSIGRGFVNRLLPKK